MTCNDCDGKPEWARGPDWTMMKFYEKKPAWETGCISIIGYISLSVLLTIMIPVLWVTGQYLWGSYLALPFEWRVGMALWVWFGFWKSMFGTVWDLMWGFAAGTATSFVLFFKKVWDNMQKPEKPVRERTLLDLQ